MNILFERLKEINAKRFIDEVCLQVEGPFYKEEESPNNLDPDLNIEEEDTISDEIVENEVKESLSDLKEYAESITPQEVNLEEKEESMDMLCSDPCRKEDTSGNTKSNVYSFLEKYAEGNDAIQILRRDLMSVTSDMHWIKESNNQHEQWALDFADALNELSVSI